MLMYYRNNLNNNEVVNICSHLIVSRHCQYKHYDFNEYDFIIPLNMYERHHKVKVKYITIHKKFVYTCIYKNIFNLEHLMLDT